MEVKVKLESKKISIVLKKDSSEQEKKFLSKNNNYNKSISKTKPNKN